MTERVVLVTGSRNWAALGVIYRALESYSRSELVELIVGDCPTGADEHARRWARVWEVPLGLCRADWKRYGKRAGPLRNGEMVRRLAEFRARGAVCQVEAFPLSVSKGTRDCMKQARAAGFPVREWDEKGRARDG